MKRIKLLIFIALCFMIMPCAYASTASTRITGNNTIKVGETTTLYVNVDSSGPIRGVDVSYSSSGSISVVSTSPDSGLVEQSRNGNRILLYTSGSVGSGSSVLKIVVKGDSVGQGVLSINRLEATVSGETAVSNSASITINVNPTKTQAEIDAENRRAEERRQQEEEKRIEEEKKKAEEEEAKRIALSKAEKLVEAAEKSLMKDDYEAALKAVDALEDSDSKTKLLDRLYEVKFNMAVKEKCGNVKCEECVCKECKNSNGLLILNIVLLLVVIGEFIYIIVRRNKENY